MTTLVTRDSRLLPTKLPTWGPWYTTVGAGQGSIPLTAGPEGQPLTRTYEVIYESNPNCAAVVNKLTRLISTIPVKVYDRPVSEGAPEEVRGHPLGKLLNQPAPRKGQVYWKQALIRQALIHGNGLLAKWRGAAMIGEPQALLAVAWPWVAAYAPLGAPVEWFSTFQTGLQRFFQVTEAVHLAWESQDLHGLGVSPLKPLAESIKLDDALRRYQVASFANGLRPGVAITPPEGFRYQGNERELLRGELQRIHGGVDNAMKAALLAPGFKMEPISHTAQEAEVIAARQLGREEFAMVYDVPPPMIGDLTHGTYSNVEELHRILYVTTLRPWIKLTEEILQAQLIDEEESWSTDLYAQFDLTEVLRGNKREEIDAASEAFNNGLATLNEARAIVDMPPVSQEADPEGLADIPHIGVNNLAPITAQSKEPEPVVIEAGPHSEGDPNEIQPKPQSPVTAKRLTPLKEDETNR